MLVAVALMIEALAVDKLLGYEVECSGQATGSELVVFVRKSCFLPVLSVSVAEIVAVAAVVDEVAAVAEIVVVAVAVAEAVAVAVAGGT